MLWIGAISSGLTTSTASQDPPLIQTLDLGQGAKNTMLLRSRCVVIMVQRSRSVFHKYGRKKRCCPLRRSAGSYIERKMGLLFRLWCGTGCIEPQIFRERWVLCMSWKMTCISIFIHGQDSPLWSNLQVHPQCEQLKLLSTSSGWCNCKINTS